MGTERTLAQQKAKSKIEVTQSRNLLLKILFIFAMGLAPEINVMYGVWARIPALNASNCGLFSHMARL